MSLAEKFLRERQRSDSQRPEAWLLRDYIKARRAKARCGFRRVSASGALTVAAEPDRPVTVDGSQKAAGGKQGVRCRETTRRRHSS